MMPGPHLRIVTPPATMAIEQPRQTLRLKLKPKAPATGYVDGAWWPRSRDLSTELPALVAVLAIRLGDVQRVSYNLATWDAAPRRLDVNGRQLRLGGFHAQHAHTVDVIGANGARLTLLVLPPGADPDAAHRTLITASRRDNVDSIADLLAATAAPEPATGDDSAMGRWEVERGAARYGS
jgi:uncharacterized protein DUF5994